MILDVRPFLPGPGADEGTGLEMIGRPKAASEQHPTRADQALADQTKLAVEGDWLRAAVLEIDLEVVLQVLADAGQVVHGPDASRLERCGRADPRQLQQHRRADRARRQ